MYPQKLKHVLIVRSSKPPSNYLLGAVVVENIQSQQLRFQLQQQELEIQRLQRLQQQLQVEHQKRQQQIAQHQRKLQQQIQLAAIEQPSGKCTKSLGEN